MSKQRDERRQEALEGYCDGMAGKRQQRSERAYLAANSMGFDDRNRFAGKTA